MLWIGESDGKLELSCLAAVMKRKYRCKCEYRTVHTPLCLVAAYKSCPSDFNHFDKKQFLPGPFFPTLTMSAITSGEWNHTFIHAPSELWVILIYIEFTNNTQNEDSYPWLWWLAGSFSDDVRRSPTILVAGGPEEEVSRNISSMSDTRYHLVQIIARRVSLFK